MVVEGSGDDRRAILKKHNAYERNQQRLEARKLGSYEEYDDDLPLSVRLCRLSNLGTSTSNSDAGNVKNRPTKRPFLSNLVQKSKSKVSSFDDEYDEDDIPLSKRIKRSVTSVHKSLPKITNSASISESQKKRQVEDQGQKERDVEESSRELEHKKEHLASVRRINKTHERIQRKFEECVKDVVTKEARLSLMDGLVRERKLKLKIEEIELCQVMDARKEEELKALFQENVECTKKLGCIRINNQVHKKKLSEIEDCVMDLVLTLFSLVEDIFGEHREGLKSKEKLRALVRKFYEELKTQEIELDTIKELIDGQATELDSERKKVMSIGADQHAQLEDFDLMKKQFEGQIKELKSKLKHYEKRVNNLKSKEKHVEERVNKLDSGEKHLEGGVKAFELKVKEFGIRVKEMELEKMHFESQVKELELKEKQFEGRVKELESKEKEFEGQLKEFERKKKHFESRLKELDSKENQFEGRVKEYESNEEEYEEKMKELKLKKEHFESRVKELMSKEKQLQDRVEDFESKEEEFKDQMKELKTKEQQLDGLVKDFKSKMEEFAGQVKELASKEKQFEGRGRDLESEDFKFEVELKEKPFKGQLKEHEFKEKQLKELKSKEKQFKAQVKDLESKRDTFDEQLKELDLTQKQYEVLIKSFEEEKELDNQLSPTIDGRSFQLLPIEKKDEPESFDNEILLDLKATSDPAKIALDIIKEPIVPQSKHGDDAVILDDSHIFLLKQLLIISPHVEPNVREEALELALDLKVNMRASTENSLEILGFLLLVSIYGLVHFFDEEEVLKLFEFAAQHKQAVELFQTLGFEDKISDFVQNLINNQKYIEAVRFICAYKLVDGYQPLDLLRESVQNAKLISDISCKNTNSFEIKDEARDQEIAALTNVLECISDNKLDSEDLLAEIEDHIRELNKQKVGK